VQNYKGSQPSHWRPSGNKFFAFPRLNHWRWKYVLKKRQECGKNGEKEP
jgi:hypothetical protein